MRTNTEPVPSPYFVIASSICAQDVGLDPKVISSDAENFVQVFSGNKMLPGFEAYCTVYGCHCYGQWFGQLGDGRAMGLGEVMATHTDNNNKNEQRYKI